MKRITKILLGFIMIGCFLYIGDIALRYLLEDYGNYAKEKTWKKRLKAHNQSKAIKKPVTIDLQAKEAPPINYTLKEFDRNTSIERIKQKVANKMPLVVHARIPLCDNEHQGIVPVNAKLGNGFDLRTNLYWGAKYGFKNHFKKHTDWTLVHTENNPTTEILERVVLKKTFPNQAIVYIVADAFQGDQMKACLVAYLESIAGRKKEYFELQGLQLGISSQADFLIFNGHNGLMDYDIPPILSKDEVIREASVIGCVSHDLFKDHLLLSKGYPVLMTTNLMAPEAYVMEAVIDAWAKLLEPEQIRKEAGKAYHQYQKCGIKGATRLFRHGW